MHVWNIHFKNGAVVTVSGSTFSKAIRDSEVKPFLVVDVESVTQIK
jgi:hypothetical protein